MYINMTISEVIEKIDRITKEKAQRYLDSKKVHSVKTFNDGDTIIIEAFVEAQKGIVYMPFIEIENTNLISDFHCQCCDDEESCIHKLALLLAAQVMIETGCNDYHMAQKILTAQVISNLLFKS